MVQKADLPKVENKKRKFGKEPKGKARKPVEKKREAIHAIAVTTTLIGTITRSNPRCNECGYHHNGACWICTNCGKKGHIETRCRTPPNQGTAATKGRACYEFKEVRNIKKDCPKLKERGGNF